LGNLIKVRGVVTRRSGVFPQLALVKWDCGRCGTTMGPFVVGDNADDVKPKQCVACQAKGGFTVSGRQAGLGAQAQAPHATTVLALHSHRRMARPKRLY
jgi:DNA replicative helicase MCM subunit Mcm2 (Cdc46/Mcm family)